MEEEVEEEVESKMVAKLEEACFIDTKMAASWMSHVEKRADEAKEGAFFKGLNNTKIVEVFVLVPRSISIDQINIYDPEHDSLRDVLGGDIVPGWNKRVDLFNAAGIEIKNIFVDNPERSIGLRAEFAALGDPFLNKIEHSVYENKPYFIRDIGRSTAEELSFIMRKGRALIILGLIFKFNWVEPLERCLDFPEYFLCDAFDADSILLCKLEKRT